MTKLCTQAMQGDAISYQNINYKIILQQIWDILRYKYPINYVLTRKTIQEQ